MFLSVVEVLTCVIDELNSLNVIGMLAYEVLADGHTEILTSVFLMEHIKESVNKLVIFLSASIRPVIIDLEVIIRRACEHHIEVITGNEPYCIPVIYNHIIHIEVIAHILYIPADFRIDIVVNISVYVYRPEHSMSPATTWVVTTDMIYTVVLFKVIIKELAYKWVETAVTVPYSAYLESSQDVEFGDVFGALIEVLTPISNKPSFNIIIPPELFLVSVKDILLELLHNLILITREIPATFLVVKIPKELLM